MKSGKLFLGMLVFGILLTGCLLDLDDTYTVWTDVMTYTDFSSTFQTSLSDGYFNNIELSDAQWNQILSSLTNAVKNDWTEDQLYNYYIGRRTGDSIATELKAWLLTINHGYTAIRDGWNVYVLLK